MSVLLNFDFQIFFIFYFLDFFLLSISDFVYNFLDFFLLSISDFVYNFLDFFSNYFFYQNQILLNGTADINEVKEAKGIKNTIIFGYRESFDAFLKRKRGPGYMTVSQLRKGFKTDEQQKAINQYFKLMRSQYFKYMTRAEYAELQKNFVFKSMKTPLENYYYNTRFYVIIYRIIQQLRK